MLTEQWRPQLGLHFVQARYGCNAGERVFEQIRSSVSARRYFCRDRSLYTFLIRGARVGQYAIPSAEKKRKDQQCDDRSPQAEAVVRENAVERGNPALSSGQAWVFGFHLQSEELLFFASGFELLHRQFQGAVGACGFWAWLRMKFSAVEAGVLVEFATVEIWDSDEP